MLPNEDILCEVRETERYDDKSRERFEHVNDPKAIRKTMVELRVTVETAVEKADAYMSSGRA